MITSNSNRILRLSIDFISRSFEDRQHEWTEQCRPPQTHSAAAGWLTKWHIHSHEPSILLNCLPADHTRYSSLKPCCRDAALQVCKL